jgi:hypothetical protein
VVGALEGRVRGAVIQRGDPEYAQARRVDNGSIDKHPQLIVRCVDAGDVMAALDAGRGAGLDIAVRGGATASRGSEPWTTVS